MRKQFLKISAICFAIVVIVLFMMVTGKPAFSETSVSIGSTYNHEKTIKVDINHNWEKKLSKHWIFNRIVYAPIFVNDGEVYPGLGFKLGFTYKVNEDWILFSNIGNAYAYGASNLYGLEEDYMNNFELGVEYKKFFVKFDHDSLLWVRGDKENFIFAGFNFNF